MMIPINYDAIISAMCFVAGVFAFYRIGGFSRKRYTPALAAMMITSGVVAWAILVLISVSSIYKSPPWAFTEGWKGSWGYTSSRVLMAMMWLMALRQANSYSPKCKSQVKVEL